MPDAGRYAGRTLDVLTPPERHTLEELGRLLGVEEPLASWWRVVPLRDAFQVVAARRIVNQLEADGMSRTAAATEAGVVLGLGSGRTVRRRLKQYPEQANNPERPWRRRGPAD